MKRITSRQNPVVARYRAAGRGETADLMLLDGAHLLREALGAGIRVRHVAVTPDALDRPEIRDLVARIPGAESETASVPRAVMDLLSPVRSASGIVALADRPAYRDSQVNDLPAPVVLIAVDVQDPGNLGAMIRVAEAASASGVIAAGACADPFGWKALRGSMGSALRLPVLRCRSAAEALAHARRHRWRIVATVPRAGHSLFGTDLSGPTAVLVGGEGGGLPAAALDMADERVTVPMGGSVESLNAGVTAALVLYEAYRQRAAARA